MRLPDASRPLPGAARSHSADIVSPLAIASDASTSAVMEPDVPKTASPLSHGRKPYSALSSPETASPDLVAVGVKVCDRK